MTCQCYPEIYGLNRGCRGPSECWVRRENRLLGTEEGREQLRQEYHAQFSEQSNQRSDFGDLMRACEKIGVPKSTLDAAAKPDNRPSLGAVKHWWHQRNKVTLSLLGRPGTGKSVAAAWSVIQRARSKAWWKNLATGQNQTPVVWLSVSTLRWQSLDSCRDSFQAMERSDLVVLDDIAIGLPDWLKQQISGLICFRNDAKKQTVVTSNLALSQLVQALDDRAHDRIKGSACFEDKSQQSMRTGMVQAKAVL